MVYGVNTSFGLLNALTRGGEAVAVGGCRKSELEKQWGDWNSSHIELLSYITYIVFLVNPSGNCEMLIYCFNAN